MRSGRGWMRFTGSPLPWGVGPRTAFAAAAVVILALWASVFLLLEYERHRDEAQAREVASSLAGIMEEHASATLGLVDQVLRFAQHEIREGRWNDLVAAVPLSLHRGLLVQMAYVDESGEIRNRAVDGSTRPNLFDRDYFRALSQARADLWIGVPVESRFDGTTIVPVARRLTHDDGTFAGVVVAAVDPEYFGRIYNLLKLPHDSSLALVGLDGIVRMRRINGRFEAGADISSSPLMGALARGIAVDDARRTSPFDGKARVHGVTRLPQYPLAAVVGISTDAMTAERGARLYAYVGTALLLSLAIAFAAWALKRRLDASERERLRAEDASRAKSDLLAHVSHELRTPLHGILGFAEYLERRLANPRERESAALIHRSGLHLLDLTNLVLDVARAEAGRLELEIGDEDVAEIVRATAAVHAGRAAAKGLRFEVFVDPSAEGRYRCDRTRLASVVGNLLDNAVKFTESGSVRLGVRRAGDAFVMRVADTGPGIPPVLREAVFERFEQGDAVNEARRMGTGLGLALVREIVNAMHGSLTVEATEGGGTTFHLRLPMRASGASGPGRDDGAAVEPERKLRSA